MPPRRRTLPPNPPAFPPFPSWARVGAPPESPGEAAFLAGAALAALHPIARAEHPLASLWRQRLALACAAAVARRGGRTEDEAALRDAWYLRRAGDDPGPAGRILEAWRALSQRAALRSEDWTLHLAAMLELRLDDGLQDVLSVAAKLAKGQGSAVAAAAEIAAVSLRFRPDSDALALWLADAVLAHRLNWPAPVPLLAGQVLAGQVLAGQVLAGQVLAGQVLAGQVLAGQVLAGQVLAGQVLAGQVLAGQVLAGQRRRGDFFRAAKRQGDDDARLTACCVGYARAAAAAADLYADLARRAERLLAVAPKLRGKDADIMAAILIGEDAQAANCGGPGKTTSDRSSRRLFERLVALGAVRELTGRATFRLYGL
ncbi:DUF1403 family protein [Methylocapsa acidiphila]|uniref:DUF1403 family protein n=1 Tax=Methylocapsa acidiphila TaxID=133552 RepID=UPI0004051DBF|nr:DUF1403 family protein [Methylocapsa acidiphila]